MAQVVCLLHNTVNSKKNASYYKRIITRAHTYAGEILYRFWRTSPSEKGPCLILLKRSTINYFLDEWSTVLLIEDSYSSIEYIASCIHRYLLGYICMRTMHTPYNYRPFIFFWVDFVWLLQSIYTFYMHAREPPLKFSGYRLVTNSVAPL